MGPRAQGAQHPSRVGGRRAQVRPTNPVMALQLLGAWNRIAGAHVALAAGCSCGVGATNLRASDFEAQILDFIETKHGRRASSIAELLAGIARANDAAATALLADFKNTLDSFERDHSGR